MAYPEVKLKLPKVTQYVLHTPISIQYACYNVVLYFEINQTVKYIISRAYTLNLMPLGNKF